MANGFPKMKLPPAQGEEVFSAILMEEEVLEMRRLYYQRGLCIRCISLLQRIAYATAYDAIKGRSWKFLPMPEDLRSTLGSCKKAGKYKGLRTRAQKLMPAAARNRARGPRK